MTLRISTALFHQRGLSGILEQQSALVDIQSKIASGKRISSPADDPSGSVQVIRLSQARSVTEQYIRNSDAAINRLQLEENTIKSAEDILHRVRELAVQAGNSTLSNQDRAAIAIEVRQQLQGLIGLANTRDANQEFLFSGNLVNQQPFSQLAAGNIVYNGDQGTRAVQISSGQQVVDSDSGMRVFMDIENGNGDFYTETFPANTGTGVIDPGFIHDSSSYLADDYTINFVINSSGQLAYNVSGVGSGQVVPPLPQNPVNDAVTYVPGAAIRFNGIETKLDGAPVAGDNFAVNSSIRQDVFTTISQLAAALENPVPDSVQGAKLQTQIGASIENIDRAMDNFGVTRSSIGSRLKLIDSRIETNESFLLEITSTLSEIEDLDIVSAATELQQRLSSLEASQAAFVRIQGLTLFNFIR